MMVKLIGGLIICLSMSALGLKKAVMLDKRLEILNEFEKSLILLKGEIKYSAASLPEAVLSVSNRTSELIKEFYERIYEQISNNNELKFKTVWEESVTEVFKDDILSTEDKAVIREPGTQLGHLDVSMQLRSIDLCMDRLKERQMSAAEDIKEKSKLYKTMGVAGGVLVMLVLL